MLTLVEVSVAEAIAGATIIELERFYRPFFLQLAYKSIKINLIR